jgi:nucleotide-binding universal stress UspA family protein
MRILIGYDGTDAAKEALRLGKGHAKLAKGAALVVQSLLGGAKTTVEDIEKAEYDLEYAQAFFDKDAVSCETHLLIRDRHPGDDLVEFAKENAVDEIIVGVRRGRRSANCLSDLQRNMWF